MKNLFRLVFISSAIYCLIQFPLFSWANDEVKVKPRGVVYNADLELI